MKLAKLSLAAMVVAGLASSSFAADTLADAFKNGKVSGELRAWYFDREGSSSSTTSKVDSDIFATGVVLGYVTDSFYGFSAGVTIQSNFTPFADGSTSTVGTAKSDFNADMYGSGAQLSEAYINYAIAKTNVKVGRQFITSPLVNGSGSRMVKQSFEGATIVNTDLPGTTLVAGVVTKYQPRTTGNALDANANGDIGRFLNLNSLVGDYAYTLLAINKSIPGTTLTAQYATLDGKDTVFSADLYYLEAAYAGKAGDFTYGVAANYEFKSTDKITTGVKEDDGTMYGAKLSLGYSDLKTYVAYTKITDDGDVAGLDGGAGFGGGAQTAFAQGKGNKTGTYDADTRAYSIDANYDFKSIGLLAGARYTNLKYGDATTVTSANKDKEFGFTDLYATYSFTGALKGLATEVIYQDWSKDADGHDFWFKANYKF